MPALRVISFRGWQRHASVLAGQAACGCHFSGGWNLAAAAVSPKGRADWWVLPSGLFLAAVAWSGDTHPVACDSIADSGPNSKETQMLVKLRGVMGRLKGKTDLDSEAFIIAGRDAYRSAVGPDGRLSQDGLERMLASSMGQQKRSFWGRSVLGEHAVAASELAPILLHLLDADGDGNVTEKEFITGHMLMFAAAKAHTPEALVELCWRAMDADGNGTVSREELETVVRMMARVHAVRKEDKKENIGEIKRSHGPNRQLLRERSVEELVNYYMDMYDINKDGDISKEEFCQHSALQENFWLMLTSPEFEPFAAQI